jgi:hypothetical protein
VAASSPSQTTSQRDFVAKRSAGKLVLRVAEPSST